MNKEEDEARIRESAYRYAERKVDEAIYSKSDVLSLSNLRLTKLPPKLSQLSHLVGLDLSGNQLTGLPEELSNLVNIKHLFLGSGDKGNPIDTLPSCIRKFRQLTYLSLNCLNLSSLPSWIGELTKLEELWLSDNPIKDLPPTLGNLNSLKKIFLHNNHLNPELHAAYKQGLNSVKTYLRAKSKAQITLNEAKLILVGEGEVGKTCLMDSLLNNTWQEHPSTHGIEIKPIKIIDTKTKKEITLNGWDFGGQRVYRPTHQLFFSAPAVYLVVWKPREGPQQGFVKEWIQLIKRREPSAKILVVATHGGPQQRQPDIDRQELWDHFSKDSVIDFFFVDSKPDAQGHRKGITELKETIARVAATLPEVGRSVPKSFADVRAALQATGKPYMPFDEVLAICRLHNMDDEIARLFITIENRLGHLTHYENDPALRNIVILRPDWLAAAMSYVLDDEETRKAHGLVDFTRLGHLWNDPARRADTRYPEDLHGIFLRLMERFDLSYRVAGLSKDEDSNPVSLIAQLVPDTTPKEDDFTKAWASELAAGDIQQTQICRIVDATNGQSANAEGLFFQLIVRLHRYSLGRVNYSDSVHWQRGLILDDEHNGRALLRNIGNDVHITVRAAYPEYFLGMLTAEVKYLVESFWEGLRCDVMVPCIKPCGKNEPGTGMFEVQKLIAFRHQGMTTFPCMISGCNTAQDIGMLLRNAPVATATATATDFFLAQFGDVKKEILNVRQQLSYQGEKTMGRFDRIDNRTRRILSQVDKSYTDLLQLLADEATDGPRLFSLIPIKRSDFNPKQWASAKFRLILWCEHSRLPLPLLNSRDRQKGVYELEFTREWFKRSAPFLKLVTSALSLALPIATAEARIAIDKAIYDSLENYFDFGKEVIDATLSASTEANLWTDKGDSADLHQGLGVRAKNSTLRELHALLKAKDPGFGGLVRVLNKRNEFLWVHEKFAGEY